MTIKGCSTCWHLEPVAAISQKTREKAGEKQLQPVAVQLNAQMQLNVAAQPPRQGCPSDQSSRGYSTDGSMGGG